MKLSPGLLLTSREFIRRKLVLGYFEDDTYIEGINPTKEIIPFLKYLNILDSNNNVHQFYKEYTDEEMLQKLIYLYIIKRDQELDSDFRWMTRAYKGINFIKERYFLIAIREY